LGRSAGGLCIVRRRVQELETTVVRHPQTLAVELGNRPICDTVAYLNRQVPEPSLNKLHRGALDDGITERQSIRKLEGIPAFARRALAGKPARPQRAIQFTARGSERVCARLRELDPHGAVQYGIVGPDPSLRLGECRRFAQE
jgi:hypothetical protein